MRKRRRASIYSLVLLPVILFCFIFSQPAHAETVPYFTFHLDKDSVPPDGLVKVYVSANPVPDTAAAFRMRMDYDSSVLSFVGTETSSQIKTGTLMTNSDSNPICSVYVCNVGQKAAPVLSGNIISFVFKVCDTADLGKTVIGAHIDQICNYQAQQLNLSYDENLTLKINPETDLSGNAYLTALKPLTGSLVPEFSPDEFQYRMTVGAEVQSVEFQASAGDGGTVSINRRTLGKAGSDTVILATVTSKNKKAKVQYAVTVHRNAAVDNETEKSPVATATQEEKRSQNKNGGNNSKSSFSRSGTGGVKGTTGSTKAEETQSPVQIATSGSNSTQLLAANGAGTRNIYIIGNQMPFYLMVLLVVILLIQLGIMLAPWLSSTRAMKKEAPRNEDKK